MLDRHDHNADPIGKSTGKSTEDYRRDTQRIICQRKRHEYMKRDLELREKIAALETERVQLVSDYLKYWNEDEVLLQRVQNYGAAMFAFDDDGARQAEARQRALS